MHGRDQLQRQFKHLILFQDNLIVFPAQRRVQNDAATSNRSA
jgi:hypothetical protein